MFNKFTLILLALVNILFLVFIGPALISAPNWLSVVGGFTILAILLYLDIKAILGFKALVAETTKETK